MHFLKLTLDPAATPQEAHTSFAAASSIVLIAPCNYENNDMFMDSTVEEEHIDTYSYVHSMY